MDLKQLPVPAALTRLGRLIPAPVATLPLVLMLELARYRELLVAPDSLYGKKFRIIVEDLGLSLCFACVNGRFKPVFPKAQQADVDVSLSATAVDFFKLASGLEDADTLFFRRRLRMEGNTELGIAVKYWIDASERPQWLSRLATRIEAM
jgi:predicted lipid carrier protein YhbT